jgi:poly(3-hydroxybutyrate) depolymerase
LPEPYNSAKPHRLVFTLHAFNGTASQVAEGVAGYLPYYGLPALDPANNTIYVSPNGLDKGWANKGGDDTKLILDIVKTAFATLCVDESLVFSTGFSYGAAMSFNLACALPAVFRAVAVLSGSAGASLPNCTAAVPFYAQHGLNDTSIAIERGRTMRDIFVRNNGCAPAANATAPPAGSGGHVKTVYQGCKAGFPVTWVEFDGGHSPQPKDRGANKTWAADETAAFFAQFK